MKFKNKFNLKNIIYITFILIICLIIVGTWIYFKEITYAIIFGILILLIIYFYFFQSYEIDKDYFIVRYGFIKLKYKYDSISDLLVTKNNITINFKSMGFHINTSDNEAFVNEINKKRGIK